MEAGISPALLRGLDALERSLGRVVRVVSARRDPAENARVGGAAASLHLNGRALDLSAPGLSPEALAEQVDRLIAAGQMAEGGIGIYPDHVHYDVRGVRRRWRWAAPAARAQAGAPLFAGGAWTFPARDGAIVIWTGASYHRGVEKDTSFTQVAETLARTMRAHAAAGDLGAITVDVVRAVDKEDLFAELDRRPAGSVIQLHYVGHGNPGGLYCAYGHPDFVRRRDDLARAFLLSGLSRGEKRERILAADPSLLSGSLDQPATARRMRRALHRSAFLHLWGCFAGGETHRFDEDDYWSYLQPEGGAVTGVGRHLARALERPVVASRDPRYQEGRQRGTNFWHRRAGVVVDRGVRPGRPPQWLWPASGAEWVVLDAAGAVVHSEPGGAPPARLTDRVPGDTVPRRK